MQLNHLAVVFKPEGHRSEREYRDPRSPDLPILQNPSPILAPDLLHPEPTASSGPPARLKARSLSSQSPAAARNHLDRPDLSSSATSSIVKFLAVRSGDSQFISNFNLLVMRGCFFHFLIVQFLIFRSGTPTKQYHYFFIVVNLNC